MTQKILILFVILWQASTVLNAQELNATVTVNAPNLTLIDPSVISDFEKSVTAFLNNTRFTDLEYEASERIAANFTFTVTSETNATEFLADLLIQSSRPVYGSDYQSTLINYLDKPAVIPYEQFEPIVYSINNYTTPLAALLTFYVNIIIGIDKDTFSPMGGEPFFRQAEQILTLVPPSFAARDKAWTQSGGPRSRYRLLQELLNPRARPYRQLMYDYHRQGLDMMESDPIAGRTVMGSAIQNLSKVRSDIPNSVLIANWSASKTQEILDVFLPATPAERTSVYQVMSSIDPSNINKFRALR